MKWITKLFKTKTPQGGVVRTKTEVRSCSCDTDKYSVCIYPVDLTCEPLEYRNLCKACIKAECEAGSFVEFL
jgi:hypothetical protein